MAFWSSAFRLLRLVLLGASLSATLGAVDIGQSYPSLVGVTWIVPPAQRAPAATLITLWTPDDPVYRGIMPRLSDLQHRHPEAAIIGLTAADDERVQPVLEAMRGRVAYANGLVTNLDRYLPPAGLPCSVLLDAHGIVLWWGHPMDAAAPLAEALEGSLHVELTGPPPAQPRPPPPSDPADDTPVPTSALPSAPRLLSRTAVIVATPPPTTQVVVVEPHRPWWSWSFWPAPVVPCYVPAPPLPIVPPFLPPLWRWRPIR